MSPEHQDQGSLFRTDFCGTGHHSICHSENRMEDYRRPEIEVQLEAHRFFHSGFHHDHPDSSVWIEAIGQFGAFLGLLTAGLAIALKDPLTNIAGWIFILTRQPFKLGDRVQIGDQAGDVIDIRLFQFTLLEIGNWVNADQSTGRIIHVPNGTVFTQSQANYSTGFNLYGTNCRSWSPLKATGTRPKRYCRKSSAIMPNRFQQMRKRGL